MKTTPLAYSIFESCEVSSVGRTTLYAAIKRGDLKTHKVGRRTLITSKELLAWLDSLPASQIGAPVTSTRDAADIANKAVRS